MSWLANITFNWLAIGKAILELAVLLGFVMMLYHKLAHQAQADKLLRGLFVVLLGFLALWALAHWLTLPLLEMVFGASLQLLIIGLIVIFQPELRRLLMQLGRGQWFALSHGVAHPAAGQVTTKQAPTAVVAALLEASRHMMRSKTGALIVLEPTHTDTMDEEAYLERGTRINAEVSVELLLTLFFPNTPLHDGAVILDSHLRIAAAGALLPLTEEPNLSWRYGTRHRAAIGLSELGPCHCLVISEETGRASYVAEGKLTPLHSLEEMEEKLRTFYGLSDEMPSVVASSWQWLEQWLATAEEGFSRRLGSWLSPTAAESSLVMGASAVSPTPVGSAQEAELLTEDYQQRQATPLPLPEDDLHTLLRQHP